MPGFNWASTSRSRKLVTLGYPADALVRLQLGLDLAVEETRHHQGQVRRGEAASIGPRPRGRGNLRALREIRDASDELQLGLDLAVEETRNGLAAMRRVVGLQLGLDLAVEETLPSLLCPRSR